MTPSTSHPEALPDIPVLKRITQSLAMLDAILCPEWQYRYYSFNSRWNAGEEMASMRDGCGDDWFLLFDSYGAAIKGHAHESPLTGNSSLAAKIQASVPSGFASFLGEPAFSMQRASFCMWRRHGDSAWTVVPVRANDPLSCEGVEDGSAELLHLLDGDPSAYQIWAQDYYERDVSLAAVQAVYAHEPLSASLVQALNEEITPEDIAADRAEIAYP